MDVVATVKNAFRTERLQFIRMSKSDDDTKAFFKQLLNEPEVYALTMDMVLRPQSADTIENTIEEYTKALLPVLICLPSPYPSGKPTIIGELVIGEEPTPASLVQHRNVYLGLSLLPEHQNKGYGRESLDWALDWCFQHAGMHSVSLATASYNERAMHLYERMGFVNEGRRRQVLYFKRKWYDSVQYSMLEDEWEALRSKA